MARERCRLDQADRVDDDDRGERRLRHQARCSGASSNIVSRVAAAVTSADDLCARPPDRRFTAVCEVPPPDGIAPNKRATGIGQPGRHQLLVRSEQRLTYCGRRRARRRWSPVKLMSAMPAAPGQQLGKQREGPA